ncbi:MAG: hypothetical protein GWP08_10875 [Nitrospiraceae bacterium]|nr:hypothetical protein [Nitrospiraceae bacterium]
MERFHGAACAAIATLLLTVSPYYLYCGRCQMPESFALAMSFAALWRYDVWLETGRRRHFIGAAALALLMMLAKPQMGVMVVPMAFLTFARFGLRTPAKGRLYLFAALAGVPFALYLWWTSYVIIPRTGISFSGTGAFNHGRYLANPRYYLDIASSIWWWSITPPVCVLALAGLCVPPRSSRSFFAAAWLAGALSLFVLMPGMTAANGYYQIVLAPPFVLLAARAITAGLTPPRLRYAAAAALVLATAWPFAITKSLYRQDHMSDYHCGTWIRDNTPQDALVLTSSPSPATLYFADRTGWTSWQERYGKGAVFGADLINKVLPLGASLLAIPVPHDRFDNSYYAEFSGIRDGLYDTYDCYKEDAFTVFSLTHPANLTPPDGKPVTFGTLASRKYLRGAWGPNQTDNEGRTFATMGPGNRAGIRFDSPTPLKNVAIEIASPVSGQTIQVALDGVNIGSLPFPKSGKRAHIRFESPPECAKPGRHLLTFEATRSNAHGVALLLYSLEF